MPSLLKNKHYLFILTKIIKQNSIEYQASLSMIQQDKSIFDAFIRNICECED